MLPFISIGPFQFASYGIMLVNGLFIGYYLLRAELRRRQLAISPLLVVTSIGCAGLLGSKLYLGIESPTRLLSDPGFLLSRSGYTFYGAVISGVLMVLVLARRYRIPSLSLFDSVSTGAALGYGIGRLGCLLAGDGDYGTPTTLPWGMSFPDGLVPTLERVHPAPIYEFLAAALITLHLWRLGARRLGQPAFAGEVFAHYLLLTGMARLLVEFIRLNPPVLWGLSNAQLVALASISAGITLQTVVRLRHRTPAVHSIAEVTPTGNTQ